MEIKRPLLLISNDDGYQAKGIRQLIEMVSDYGDIIVCAPDDARSGYSCAFSTTSMTFNRFWSDLKSSSSFFFSSERMSIIW